MHLGNTSTSDVIAYIAEEMKWNGCTVAPLDIDDAKSYTGYKGKAKSAVYYTCLPGSGLCNDIKAIARKFDANLKITVRRIGDMSRSADCHEYVIFVG